MKIFAISDLHLSGSSPKPMDVFGVHWKNHWDKIKANWEAGVHENDVVLIPGDISWAMTLDDAIVDLSDIGSLPGKKIIIKGNHDYWWSSYSRLKNILPDSIMALQNNSVSINEISFCGTRGWTAPTSANYTEHDMKIFSRELNRLSLSLSSAPKNNLIVVLLHYPPFDDQGCSTEVMDILKSYPVVHVAFGHLHGESLKYVTEGVIEGINYHLVSCDYLNFDLKPIMEF